MNAFALSGLLLGLTIFPLGLFVLFKNRKSRIHQTLALFCFAGAIWGFGGYKIGLSTNPLQALFWFKVSYLGVIFIPVLFYHFVASFLENKKGALFYLIYVYAFFFFILEWTPWADLFFGLTNISFLFNSLYWVRPATPLFVFFVLLWFAIIFYAYYQLFKNFRKSSGIKRTQIKYFFLAAVVGFSGGGTCFLPSFGVNLYPILNFTAPFFPTIIAYAIIRYRLLDIELVVRRGLVFSLLFGVTAFIFIAGISFFENYFLSPYSGLLAAFFITVLFIPLKNLLEIATEKFLFQKRYKFEDAVTELNLILIRSPKIEELLTNLLAHLTSTLKISSAAAVMAGPQGKFVSRLTVGSDHKKIFLGPNSFLIQYFESSKEGQTEDKKEILDCGEMEREISNLGLAEKQRIRLKGVAEEIGRFGFWLALPLFSKGELIGILFLGEKRSRDPFSSRDIKFLDIVRHEAAFSIENALNVERLMRLDESKSEFIAVVSHQLRTPLSVARWNFELLLEKAFGKLPAKAENAMRDVYQTLMVLNQGLNNFISVIEIEEGKVIVRQEKAELNKDVIEETIADLKQEILAKNVQIKLRLSLKREIFLDRQKIKRVFGIIFDNAIRYSPSGSSVIVSTLWQERGERDEMLVSVEDEGIGVAPENYEVAFKKFFRGEEAKKMSPTGLGISLFIAKEYVRLHGGRLWVEKKQGPGSIFYFTIPVKESL